MSRVLSRVGLSRGRSTRGFSAADLLDAVKDYEDKPVYVALDAGGRVVCAGGGARAGAGGAARVAVRARLAGDVHARTAVLTSVGGGGGELRVAASACVPPHHELLLWPDEQLATRAALPFLSPRNVLGGGRGGGYVCHECGALFAQPNPLKAHLLLACRDHEPRRFWRALARRLLAPPPPPPPPPPLGPAQLEALCAEWGGRGAGAGGHVCVYCGKAYSRKYGLKIHVRTHTGYRPLRCPHCARAFADPSNLNKHVRLHAPRRQPSDACRLTLDA